LQWSISIVTGVYVCVASFPLQISIKQASVSMAAAFGSLW